MPFRPWMLPRALRTPDKKYNMMVVHTRLNADSLAMVMRQEAVWVTIVREPVAQFESLWEYFKMEKFYKMSLEKFTHQSYEKVARWRLAKVYGIHQMFFDFGYSTAEDMTAERMSHILETLNTTFNLVMVAERYDESLVLLKDLMCWTADDVAYLSINFRSSKSKTTKLSKEARERLLQLSYPDVQIYKFFLHMFDVKVEAFGHSRMEKELAAIQEANRRLTEMCVVEKDSPLKARKGMEWEEVVGKVTVRGDIQKCVDVARTEHDILNEVRERQKLWVVQGWRQPLSQVVVPPR
ncbi:galactosylceramide sulfotransferase-like isoform X2 [Eriocheir sinensis]|nr:galactosylceramide sulfotransferase-like isoform X2 [Eriocheir sinensis]